MFYNSLVGKKQEIVSDTRFLVEVMTGSAYKEYRFEGERGPIVGIHGVLSGWPKYGLRNLMEEEGIRGHLLYMGNLTHGIKTYLDEFDKAIAESVNPTIVSCSAGGFVALKWAQKYNKWNEINKIITLGTPFNGIPKGIEILGKTVKEITSGSNFLEEFKALALLMVKLLVYLPEKTNLLVIQKELHLIGQE